MKQKDPLYRKVNSKARHCRHNTTPDSSWSRGSKNGMPKTMKSGIQHGLDYTPLFRFLLSKVGQPWDQTYSEVKTRVLSDDEIRYMVKDDAGFDSFFRYGESAYFSSLFVDDEGLLQKIDPTLTNNDLYPSCPCCTHTFNGKTFQKKYEYGKYMNYPESNAI